MGANRTGMTGQPQPMFSGQNVTPQPMFQGHGVPMTGMMPQQASPQAQGRAINLWDLPTTALKMPAPPPTFWEQARMRRDAPVVEEAPYRHPMFSPFGMPQQQPIEQPYVNPIFSPFRRPYG